MARIDLLEEDARAALGNMPLDGLAGKTVLVTGASGIVGTHFLYGLKCCREEKEIPLQVIALVRRPPPEYLAVLQDKPFLRFLHGDLAEPAFQDRLPKADVIIHAATYGQPELFLENAAATLKLNTMATFALLERLLPGGRFLFLSSSEVYSGLTQAPFSEAHIGTTNTTHPRACYIEGKRCGEAICGAYRARGMAITAARLSLGYGPGTRSGDRRVLYAFIDRALRDGVIRLRDIPIVRSLGHLPKICGFCDHYCPLDRIISMGPRAIPE